MLRYIIYLVYAHVLDTGVLGLRVPKTECPPGPCM